MALPSTSSTTSASFLSFTPSPLNFVTERMFSVMRTSQRASLLISRARSMRSASLRFASSISTELAPSMEVSGVRRSWDTERKRSARIFSRSISKRSCSCFLICVVSVLMSTDTSSMQAKVSG